MAVTEVRNIVVRVEIFAPRGVDQAGAPPPHDVQWALVEVGQSRPEKSGAPLEQRNMFGETPLWLSELAIQFYGGGSYQIVPTSTGDLLRALGASATTPSYDRTRPRDWPDVPLQSPQ